MSQGEVTWDAMNATCAFSEVLKGKVNRILWTLHEFISFGQAFYFCSIKIQTLLTNWSK